MPNLPQATYFSTFALIAASHRGNDLAQVIVARRLSPITFASPGEGDRSRRAEREKAEEVTSALRRLTPAWSASSASRPSRSSNAAPPDDGQPRLWQVDAGAPIAFRGIG